MLLLLAVSGYAAAQAHELSLSAGGIFPYNSSTFETHAGWAIEASYAGRLMHVPLAALYFELPVVIGPRNTGIIPSITALENRQYSSLFVTPGLRLKLAPGFPVSPYLAAGVGLAHFKLAASGGAPQQTSNSTVVDFGGGLDMKVAPFLSVRGEVRDFYSGNPVKDFTSGVPLLSSITGRQHNIEPTVGLVLRF